MLAGWHWDLIHPKETHTKQSVIKVYTQDYVSNIMHYFNAKSLHTLLVDLLCIQYKSSSSKKTALLMLASTSKFKNAKPACIIVAYTCKSVRGDRVNSPICQFWNAQWKHIVTISPVKNTQRACILDSLCTKPALLFCTTSKF